MKKKTASLIFTGQDQTHELNVIEIGLSLTIKLPHRTQ